MGAFKLTLAHVGAASSVAAFFISRTNSVSFVSTLGTTLSGGILVYLAFWSWIFPFYISEMRHVPTVPGNAFIGQFFEIINSEVGVPQREWHKKYGTIIRYFFPLGNERLSIADEDALKHMTVRNPYNFPKPLRARKWMERVLGGQGILLSEGDQHIRQRKTLTAAFSIQAIRDLNPVFWKKGLTMANLMSREMSVNSTEPSTTFEILDWLNRTTLDIIGKAGFGTDIDSLENPDAPLREAYRLLFAFDPLSRALYGIQAFVPWMKHLPFQTNRDVVESRTKIEATAGDIIDSKTKPGVSKAKDIMTLIVRDNEKAKKDGDELSYTALRDQITTFLGAGHDTTATGISWTLHLLSHRPQIQEKLRQEIKRSYPELFDPASRADIFSNIEEFAEKVNVDQLPYMDNVCRESLRYIPPIPMTVRQSIRDDRLGGYPVPAGSTVYVLANAINRLPQWWGDDADTFDPDRWDNLPETYTTNAYMTFLQGPRSCIGKKFAETEMKIILCAVLSVFEFEPRKDITDPESLKMWRLVLRPRDGIQLKVSPLAS